MTVKIKDNSYALLASPITVTGIPTTATVDDASRLPASGSLNTVNVCYMRLGNDLDNEVVPVTGISGTTVTLTCQRAWPIDTPIVCTINSSLLNCLPTYPVKELFTVKVSGGDFSNIQEALDYFSTVSIKSHATINVDAGTWNSGTASIKPKKNSEKVNIVGQHVDKTVTNVQYYTGLPPEPYPPVPSTIVLTVTGGTTGISVGQYVNVNSGFTGTGNDVSPCYGCYEINHVTTDTISFLIGNVDFPPPTTVGGAVRILKTILTNNLTATSPIQLDEASDDDVVGLGELSNLVILGSDVRPAISIVGKYSIRLKSVGIRSDGVGISIRNGASAIFLGDDTINAVTMTTSGDGLVSEGSTISMIGGIFSFSQTGIKLTKMSFGSIEGVLMSNCRVGLNVVYNSTANVSNCRFMQGVFNDISAEFNSSVIGVDACYYVNLSASLNEWTNNGSILATAFGQPF